MATVLVGQGDQIQIRYPTPSTWNTQVTVEVQIGTGLDPDAVVFGTRIPNADIDPIFFTYQQASLAPQGSLSSPEDSEEIGAGYERDTFYYSEIQIASDIEIIIPISLTASSNGPRAAFENVNTADCAFALSDTSGNFTDPPTWITSGTIQNGQRILLRIRTEDWYTTTTNVELTIGDEIWGTDINEPAQSPVYNPGDGPTNNTAGWDGANTFKAQWQLTTRAQDQSIDQFAFTDEVDFRASDSRFNGGYIVQEIPLTGIDQDVVLQAQCSAVGGLDNLEIALTNTPNDGGVVWSKFIDNITYRNDGIDLPALWVRVLVGDYTTATAGQLNVYTVENQTYTDPDLNFFDNNSVGVYGRPITPGVSVTDQNDTSTFNTNQRYSVTQELADIFDDWNVFTEVDRYIDPVATRPIYVIRDGNKVVVSSDNQFSFASPSDPSLQDFLPSDEVYYYTDLPISGLGVEYPAGAYDNLDAPFSSNSGLQPADLPLNTDFVDGRDVEVRVFVSLGNISIRKNFTGDWVQSIYVQNGDILTVRQLAAPEFEQTRIGRIEFAGTTEGGPEPEAPLPSFPDATPTNGPTTPSFSPIIESELTTTIITRPPREQPSRFTFGGQQPLVYFAEPGQFFNLVSTIDSVDQQLTAGIIAVDSTGSGGGTELNATFGYNNSNYNGSTQPLPQGTTLINLRFNASSTPGATGTITVAVGDYQNVIYVFTKISGRIYQIYEGSAAIQSAQIVDLETYYTDCQFICVGAPGGKGGNDEPNSFGGTGGFGSWVRGEITFTDTYLQGATPQLLVYPGQRGADAVNFAAGAAGGAGGWGYAIGGDGGNAGPNDASGGGGGGGGASAIALADATPLVIAGGGGGGGGAGNDSIARRIINSSNTVALDTEKINGNYNSIDGYTFTQRTTLSGLLTSGDAGETNITEGGGGGGGGGGWGTGGIVPSERLDENGVPVNQLDPSVAPNDDIDATGGQPGDYYYITSPVLDGGSNELANLTPFFTVPVNQAVTEQGDQGFVILSFPPQDLDPVPFSIPSATSDILTTVESVSTLNDPYILITGITGEVPVSISGSGGEISIADDVTGTNATPFSSALQTIVNNQAIRVRLTTGSDYDTVYSTTVNVGNFSTVFQVQTNPAPDIDPVFSFDPIPTVDGVEISTLTESIEVQVLGINVPVDITATNVPDIAIAVCPTAGNCGAFISGGTVQTINSGEYFKVRYTSSPDFNTSLFGNIFVGSGSTTFEVRTKEEPDLDPDPLVFLPLVGQERNTEVISNAQVIQGISEPIELTIVRTDSLPETNDAVWVLNNAVTGSNVVTVDNNDSLRILFLTGDGFGAEATFDIDVTDGVANPITTWSVTTTGTAGVNPDPFVFTSQFGAPNTLVENDPTEDVTIAGLAVGLSVGVEGTNGIQFRINEGLAGDTNWQPYSEGNLGTIQNGDTLSVRLLTSSFGGFERTGQVRVGNYTTTFTVIATGDPSDPILGQWYSSIQTIKPGVGDPIRYSTKYDGLPIGTMIPVFKDSTVLNADGDADGWGILDGTIPSRFHSWIYCDGRALSPQDFPLLYELLGLKYGGINTNLIDVGGISVIDSIASNPAGDRAVFQMSSGETTTDNGIFVGGVITLSGFTGDFDPVNGNKVITSTSPNSFEVFANLPTIPALETVGPTGDQSTAVVIVTTSFRLPDLRNRRICGTGPIDGNALSSPALVPSLGPAKTAAGAANENPGSQGGQWFIRQIDDPQTTIDETQDNTEFEQVYTPPAGQPPQESPFFSIVNVQTTGYTDIQGSVEFETYGTVSTQISLEEVRIFEIPNHSHEIISGVGDELGGSGLINWNGGGCFTDGQYTTYPFSETIDAFVDPDGDFLGNYYTVVTNEVTVNIWGYCTDDYAITTSRIPILSGDNTGSYGFAQRIEGFPDDPSEGIWGYDVDDEYSHLNIEQREIRSPNGGGAGSANFEEINRFIDLEGAGEGDGGPVNVTGGQRNHYNPGDQTGQDFNGNNHRFVASIDIENDQVIVDTYRPAQRAVHSHYISFLEPTDNDFSWGAGDGPGVTTINSPFANSVLDVVFSASGLGQNVVDITVLPGTFTLSQTKQLIPVPELEPNDDVPLIFPYTYVRWLIKAF